MTALFAMGTDAPLGAPPLLRCGSLRVEHGTGAGVVADLVAFAAYPAPSSALGLARRAPRSACGIDLGAGAGIVSLIPALAAGSGEASTGASDPPCGRLGIEFGTGAGIVAGLFAFLTYTPTSFTAETGRSAQRCLRIHRRAGSHIVAGLFASTADSSLRHHITRLKYRFSIYESFVNTAHV